MSVIAATGDGMAKNDCVRRALDAAFRYAGAWYPIDILDDVKWSKNLQAFCKKLGLEVYTEGVILADSRPCLVIYEVPNPTQEDVETSKNEDGVVYHCVFCSDCGPIHRYKVHTMVLGWEKLTL